MDEQILSGSSVNTFLRCAKQWEFAYVYEIKRPPSLRQALGVAAHSAVELNYAQKVQTHQDLDLTDVLDVFSTSFDAGTLDSPSDEDETKDQAKDSGIKTVTAYHRLVAPPIQPVWVEQEVQFRVNGIPYGGTLDLVDDQRRLRDLKNVKRKPGKDNHDYLLAMTGYALGYRHLTNEIESDVVLDYMVRTKEPYYWPVASEGPISTKAVRAFASIVGQVSAAIKAGVFLPTGLQSHACSWCGYTEICDAYQTQ